MANEQTCKAMTSEALAQLEQLGIESELVLCPERAWLQTVSFYGEPRHTHRFGWVTMPIQGLLMLSMVHSRAADDMLLEAITYLQDKNCAGGFKPQPNITVTLQFTGNTAKVLGDHQRVLLSVFGNITVALKHYADEAVAVLP